MIEGRPTGALPRIVMGTSFRCYRLGNDVYRWISEDERCMAWGYKYRASYSASVDGITLEKRFRSLEGAMKGALLVAGKKP